MYGRPASHVKRCCIALVAAAAAVVAAAVVASLTASHSVTAQRAAPLHSTVYVTLLPQAVQSLARCCTHIHKAHTAVLTYLCFTGR